MATPKLIHKRETNARNARRKLAEVRAISPTSVVIWYEKEGETGVLISEGTERIRTLGALAAMAIDTWRE